MAAYREDTIAAVATAVGPAPIAIVRLSGRAAIDVARRVLTRPGSDAPLPLDRSHHAIRACLRDPATGIAIDDVLVLPMLAPRSYTGEDTIEIHCHGGRVAPQRALRALLSAGARGARPGEFTERAFVNGKLDLCQAEGVAELIAASSDQAAAAAREQLEGRLSVAIAALRDRVLDARALAEAHLDFPEDDIPASALGELTGLIGAAERSVAELAETYGRGRLLREGARVVLIGKPNAGKSSLLNAILGRDRALVSPDPGTTRDYLEEPAALEGCSLLVCDTAGVRRTGEAVEQAGIERTRELVARSDLALVVLDASAPIDDLDREVWALARTAPKRLVVRNKADLRPAWHGDGLSSAIVRDGDPPLADASIDVSALSGAGVSDLGAAVLAALFAGSSEGDRDRPVVVLERHRAGLISAAERIAAARQGLDGDAPLEIVALELQTACLHLEEILGAATPEDVLERIFARFCIGK